MTMMHHDNRDKEVAVAEAAALMREKLNGLIKTGKARGAAAVQKVVDNVPTDRYRYMSKTRFLLNPAKTAVVVSWGEHDEPETIHDHALGQIAEVSAIRRDFLKSLMDRSDETGPWGLELIAYNLNTLFKHIESRRDRRLIRSVGGQTRGFLSDSYNRYDPGQMINAFVQACQDNKLLPYDGYAGDTQFMFKAVLNEVIEPVKNEVLGIGVVFRESPFGNGATELSVFMQRMYCTNTAIMTSELRKVHITSEAPIDADDAREKYETATKQICATIKRHLREQLNPDYLHQLAEGVRAAHAHKVDHKTFEAFLKRHLAKDQTEKVIEHYRSADITNLPPGDTTWRAANAISWYANEVEDPETQYELQKLTGKLLQNTSVTAKKGRK